MKGKKPLFIIKQALSVIRKLATQDSYFFLFVLLFVCNLFYRKVQGNELNDSIMFYPEQVIMHIDREVYISGEDIFFSACCFYEGEKKPTELSKILYVEMLDHLNRQILARRYKLSEGFTNGSIQVPVQLQGGEYILRAYTNWMRNFPPEKYFHQYIIIVNPGSSLELSMKNDTFPAHVMSEHISKDSDIHIDAQLHKSYYQQRDLVHLTVSISNKEGLPMDSYVSVSVCRKGLSGIFTDSLIMHNRGFYNFNDVETISENEILYLPETYGLMLEGSINNQYGNGIDRQEVFLTISGKNPYFMTSTSNTKGMFYFILDDFNNAGEVDIYAYHSPSEIKVVEHFSNKYADLSVESGLPVYLDKENIKQAMIAGQINRNYGINFIQNFERPASYSEFYGIPDESVLMANFVNLPNMEEVFRELFKSIIINKVETSNEIRLFNRKTNEFVDGKPLILIDGIKINNLSDVLALKPAELKKIDVIASPYCIGNVVFGGIISIITNEDNWKVNSTATNRITYNFEVSGDEEQFTFPDYSQEIQKQSHIPDFRNTLYWQPYINVSDDGFAKFSFYTSDEVENYEVVVRAISAEGFKGQTLLWLETR